MTEKCKHCGESIHQNEFDKVWRHWDSFRKCVSNPRNEAEPVRDIPDNIELGGMHD